MGFLRTNWELFQKVALNLATNSSYDLNCYDFVNDAFGTGIWFYKSTWKDFSIGFFEDRRKNALQPDEPYIEIVSWSLHGKPAPIAGQPNESAIHSVAKPPDFKFDNHLHYAWWRDLLTLVNGKNGTSYNNATVLVPRPDMEKLVDAAMDEMKTVLSTAHVW